MNLLNRLKGLGLVDTELRQEQYHLIQYNDKNFRIIKNKFEIKERL